ncbi:hypothetical protein GTP58_13235 [Duganella sp. CY15W]|uniref:hypothetical protein n=1 Tax=Duganella sp. CY15W TaxID=2692172 RepID=UPI001370C656|nr:hypothetical protein [Duganella sp. CY15W]MYM29287.1 hypothetical protein [Duganella sp. CY15W]
MTTFIVRGKLGNIPSGVWEKGYTRFAYLDVGDHRIDNVTVDVYLDASLIECAGEDVELSLCKIRGSGYHLAAIKTEGRKILRLPDPKGFMLGETLVGAVVWGLVALITTALGGPILLGIALYPMRAILPDDEKIFAPIMFALFFALWAIQLTWFLFYSKRFSPRMRLKAINQARFALD